MHLKLHANPVDPSDIMLEVQYRYNRVLAWLKRLRWVQWFNGKYSQLSQANTADHDASGNPSLRITHTSAGCVPQAFSGIKIIFAKTLRGTSASPCHYTANSARCMASMASFLSYRKRKFLERAAQATTSCYGFLGFAGVEWRVWVVWVSFSPILAKVNSASAA